MNKMNITNAKYHKNRLTKENISISCIIDGTHFSVPLDPDNTHYAEILEQVKAGTLTIADAD
tara:strand:- start:19 stop:204 length:186 start_codon:yes stop_codon:yes gene_type:complete